MSKLTTLQAINVCRGIKAMPDGTPIKPHSAHTLLVLVSYYPNICPTQGRLAADLKITRRALNYRLNELEASGLIWRTRRGYRSTLYGIRFGVVRLCEVGRVIEVQRMSHEDQEENQPDDDGWFVG